MWSNKEEEKLKVFSKKEERKFMWLTIELREMLTDTSRVMVNNQFKVSFYGKKKFNVLIIVLIIHVSIAFEKKKKSEYISMFSTKLINFNRSNLVSKLCTFPAVGI